MYASYVAIGYKIAIQAAMFSNVSDCQFYPYVGFCIFNLILEFRLADVF